MIQHRRRSWARGTGLLTVFLALAVMLSLLGASIATGSGGFTPQAVHAAEPGSDVTPADIGAPPVSVRDKGEIPLGRPDSKVVGGIDPPTGYVWAAFIDLQAHTAVVWWQACGCYLPGVWYGNVNLVGWTGFSHDGHFKILAKTWDENGGDIPGRHFVVIDLGPVPTNWP